MAAQENTKTLKIWPRPPELPSSNHSSVTSEEKSVGFIQPSDTLKARVAVLVVMVTHWDSRQLPGRRGVLC